MIPVYKPYLPTEVLKHAHEALDSTWISSKGPYITNVEKILSEMHTVSDVRINVATTTNNGTTAMHLVARLLKKNKPNITTIIVPNNVYVAAWNAFLFDKNYTLEAVEADPYTWNYDMDKLYEVLATKDLETTALLVVHNMGNVVNVPKIQRDWKGLVVVEDNCEGLFGKYEDKPTGSVSLAAAISFFGNKSVTSGEGGAVIADNHDQGFLYTLRSQGQSEDRYIHNELGYNYRMTNVQAALLYGQLSMRDKIFRMKKNVFSMYKDLLLNIDEVQIQQKDPNTKHSKWMFGIHVNGGDYYEVEKFFNANHIEVRPMFYPIHRHSYLRDIKVHGGCDVATTLNKECVILPSYPELQDHEIAHVVNTLKQYLARNK